VIGTLLIYSSAVAFIRIRRGGEGGDVLQVLTVLTGFWRASSSPARPRPMLWLAAGFTIILGPSVHRPGHALLNSSPGVEREDSLKTLSIAEPAA